MEIITAIGSINALIIALLISGKKGKSISDKILIAWVLNFALHFAILLFINLDFLMHPTNWGFLLGNVLVLHSAFLYVYTKSLTDKNFRLNLKTLSNFGVVILYTAAFTPMLSLSYEERMDLVVRKQNIPYQIFLPMFTLLFCRIFYLVHTVIVLIRHKYNIRSEFSYEEKIDLDWIKYIVIGFALLIVFTFVAYALLSAQIISVYQMDSYLTLVNMVLFFGIAYYGFKQKNIYELATSSKVIENHNAKKEYDKKTVAAIKDPAIHEEKVLSKPFVDEKLRELQELMTDKQVYLDPELNIGDLANRLSMHSHQLSKLINIELNQNFYEYVNAFRIEEFKKLAADPKNKHLSILGLALDSGFNSKATFNRIFKSSTGQTPSDFRINLKN